MFFKRFTRNALAVHYLTQAEYNDSGDGWNRKHVILSNGVVENSDKQWKAKTYPKKREGLKGVFIGRISMFHKGLDLLVEACKTIQEELRKAHLTIDIYGPDRQLHREILMKSITDAHVEDILLVHTKPIFGEEKERIMLDSDFFVLTSRLEGHPMGLIEALSYGMPSLVTRGSNMMDEIAKADAGWCSENTTEGIATSFKQLLKDVERLADKSEKAVELAQMYNWDSIAQRTHTEYSKLLKG